ncbi:MAG: NADP-dependent phosphogluconate dehydrogenase, partial [Methylomonas sp.]|nr:NADP-dependent phosphogluconate dehydrogenase [Methylomonas sp.]
MSTNNENAMQIGMVGLGKMGANMVKRLLAGGHQCVGYDVNSANVEAIVNAGAIGAASLQDLVGKLPTPRIVWCMVPAGELTEAAIDALGELMESGDVIIDGGNSFYKDDVRRSEALAKKGIHYIDVGTSGG